MRRNYAINRNWIRGAAVLVLLAGMSSALPAQTTSVTYDLENVWLLPDISDPGDPARQMTGSFSWTYMEGDFENGVGRFLDVSIPWSSSGLEDLEITFDLNSIEFVDPLNQHDIGLDVTLFLLDDLSPVQPSPIDTVRSQFDIQNGISHKGHVESGTVNLIPAMDLVVGGNCPADVEFTITNVTPNGQVALLYAQGEGALVVPIGANCGGTALGLNGTTRLGVVITADATGVANLLLGASLPPAACGNYFLQALDLTSCRTSDAALLQ